MGSTGEASFPFLLVPSNPFQSTRLRQQQGSSNDLCWTPHMALRQLPQPLKASGPHPLAVLACPADRAAPIEHLGVR